MSAAWLALVLVAAPANRTLGRSGLWGWGLGVEAPLVGVLTGVGTKSFAGVGYNLGGALSWEATPRILLRVYGQGGETFGGTARLRYVADVAAARPGRSDQPAHWLGAELGLGGAYLFREPSRAWAPFVGVDAGLTFAGYDFYFDESVAELESIDVGDAVNQCTGEECRSAIHDALQLGFVAGVRGGVRFELASWLASQVELAVSYVPTGDERVSNTVLNREVRSAPEGVFLVRGTFSVRLGL
jgi:hypothetical protein